jgi:chemotaxis methyl-accepting protein methylase
MQLRGLHLPYRTEASAMMHRLASTVTVLDCEITDIRLLMERHAGVLLERSSESLTQLIVEYLDTRHINSTAELVRVLQSSPTECDLLLESLLPGDTGFFRHPAVFDALARQVVPQLKSRKAGDDTASLRIWSAGCSTGEEPYSIAMALCEALHGSDLPCNIHIVGSDIRNSALETAKRALYPSAALQSLPNFLVGSYFSRVGDHFLVKPRLRNLVTFTPMNLANPTFIGRFDCIFCMDLLPHFSASQRAMLLQRLFMFLEPGGYLFLGENEKVALMDVSFIPQSHLGCAYLQRPFAAAAKSGR